ncbi:hypothetical protein [Moorena sp. SIO3E8]|uniref:hypothetical protein n=1 Tax=Moorena sp. SIO3E8 TaxID=2607830 RepID=UPI0025EB71AE|nr:hypothetical protein [Moorena sp. SIO3E8]
MTQRPRSIPRSVTVPLACMPFGQGQSHSIALITSKVNRIFSQTPDSRLPIPDSRFPNFVTKIFKICYN